MMVENIGEVLKYLSLQSASHRWLIILSILSCYSLSLIGGCTKRLQVPLTHVASIAMRMHFHLLSMRCKINLSLLAIGIGNIGI